MRFLLVASILVLISFAEIGSVSALDEREQDIMPDMTAQAVNDETPLPSNIAEPEGSEASSDEESFDDFDFSEFEDDTVVQEVQIADPLFYWNKGMYHFNDKLYFWILKPAARGYKWVVPEPARIGISNFFYNIRFPIRLVDCLLQAKGHAALGECGRFGLNTTVGVLGFGNPARKYPYLSPSEEDMGQAFGRWGIGNGFYVVWPFLGPSSLRDSFGLLGDYAVSPINYLFEFKEWVFVRAFETVNETSLHIGDYEAIKDVAIDPYIAIRNGYVQLRQKKVEE